MNYCSECGSDKIELKTPKGDNRTRFVCPDCGTVHYSNPKIVAGCLPVYKGKVLLAKRAIEPRAGYWNLPAGYLENGETVEDGAKREVWEETLGKVNIQDLICLYSIYQINQIYIIFRGDLIDGKYGIGEESTEVRLFAEDEIPWREMAFTSSIFALKKYFQDAKSGEHKTHLGRFHPDDLKKRSK